MNRFSSVQRFLCTRTKLRINRQGPPIQPSLFTEMIDHSIPGVQDGKIYRHTAIQAVSRAAQSRVVGAYGHFHPVKNSLVVFASFDGLFSRLIYRKIDRGIIVCRPYDQVYLGDQAVVVALVVMN